MEPVKTIEYNGKTINIFQDAAYKRHLENLINHFFGVNLWQDFYCGGYSPQLLLC